MIVDFSALNLSERQVLLLKNLDDTVLCPLMMAHKLEAKFCLMDVSEITFELPSQAPGYEQLTGMRVIDWVGIGQFILMNPEEQDDGAVRYKNCKAYSLEHELSYKQTYIAEGTHNLRDVMDMVLEDAPSWSIGRFDASLLNKYRTFDATKENTYDFLRGTVQELYGVLFDFDTYNRKINVIDAEAFVATKPVYISLHNLAKEIKIEENTEDIYTCIDVNGADGVDIRTVNPLGTNYIYNLDYYMTPEYFSADMIQKWMNWKNNYESCRSTYFNLMVRRSLQETNLITEKAALTDLQGQKSAQEELQGAYVESEGKGADETDNLQEVKDAIEVLDEKIAESELSVSAIEADIASLTDELVAIKTSCGFNQFFTEDELKLLDRYFKVNTLTEESFVYTDVVSYAASDAFSERQNVSIDIQDADITCVKEADSEIYTVVGGSLQLTVDVALTTESVISAPITRASFQKDADGKYLFTAELGSGAIDATQFKRGCISLIGNDFTYEGDLVEDEEILDYWSGTHCTVVTGVSRFCFTQNTTEYTKRAIEWDLLEYGETELQKLAYPRYKFSVESANFFMASEFDAFKRNFELGTKCYLKIDDRVLTPIVVGAEVNVEDFDSLKIQFSDEYSAFDTAFKIADLLTESVSMGKTLAAGKASYNAFRSSNAADVMYQWYQAPLDMAKNAILSSSGQAIQIDGSGIRLRAYIDPDNQSLGYKDKQIWMSNNSIVFTKNNWSSAEMAIGEFVDEYLGEHYGIRAPALVGTIMASTVLNVRSAKEHGGVAELLVDGDGARLLNSRFTLANEYETGLANAIMLDPDLGIVAGASSSSVPMVDWDEDRTIYGVTTDKGNVIKKIYDLTGDEKPNASFWIDMDGRAYFNGDGIFNGTVYATDGEFTGTVYATDGEFSGTIHATDGEFSGTLQGGTISGSLKGVTDDDGNSPYLTGIGLDIGNGNFVVDEGGNVTMDGNIVLGGSITWKTSSLPYRSQFSVTADGPWVSTMTDDHYYRRDSYDGGSTWGTPYQFRGQNGKDGNDGDDANVNWKNIKAALQKADGVQDSFITADEMGSPRIYGGEIYGANIYAGDGSTDYYSQMNDDGFTIWYEGDVKARMYSDGEDTGNPVVGIDLGRGTVQEGAGAWQGAGIFHLYKDSKTAYVIYNTPTNEEVGFVFHDDATITVKGALNGITGEGAVAVFG